MHASVTDKPGLSVFLPAYNDSGTIASLVITSLKTAARLTPDFEVIIVNDGSADATAEIADELARTYPQVRVVHHEKNRGYGGALRTGFASATRDLIFYTDGDAQRSGRNGGVVGRLQRRRGSGERLQDQPVRSSHHHHHRRIYHHTVKILFGLKVRDVDCDFRLMRRAIFERVVLEKNSGVICLEMMKKSRTPASGSPVPVHHYHRAFGKSQFFNFRRLFKTGVDVMKLWFALVIRKDHRRTNDVPSSRTATSSLVRHERRPGLTVDAPAPAGGGDYKAYYRGRRVMITGGSDSSAATWPGSWSISAPRSLRRFADPRLRRKPLQHPGHRLAPRLNVADVRMQTTMEARSATRM